MQLSRREFAAGALGAVVAAPLRAAQPLRAVPRLEPTIEAIRAYGEAHRAYFGLPGMTLGLALPGATATVLDFGYSEVEARRPITPDTLFQIGSISKSMTAAVIHQLAAEGRFGLTDRASALLPGLPLPAGNRITVQNLLDHVSGLPDSAPLSAAGGLWVGYAPGAHWSYSNTGYDILGLLAEHFGGKPLAQLFGERIFAPLGMQRTRGAIVSADRLLYAQGYGQADPSIPFIPGQPLAPAAWIDSTSGAGSVASTADDMTRFLRALAGAAEGRGGLGLSPAAASAFASHAVPSDTPGMRYGNGLMHVVHGGRPYLHHTGGMVSFSSSFHLDAARGVGAFASSTISAFAEYRPRLLTQFAVEALTNALAGRPLPAPPGLAVRLPQPAVYAGEYRGPSGGFEIRAGDPLTLVAGGRSAPLLPIGGDLLRTTHTAFRAITQKVERTNRAITGASWGPNSYLRAGTVGTLPRSDPALARLAGRYVNDSPWWGIFTLVERGGRLWLGTETPMAPISGNLWRIGSESWSPERGDFANFIDGRPQTFILSGNVFARQDV
jgi:CubicO group peptidase (beta-lactamase class C family)